MENKKRNYGIDLLRVVSMIFVVILHSLGRGGVLNFYKSEDTGYYVFWFFETVAYCAVDIFGLISGYVGYSDEEKPFKMKNYALLWLQTVFLGLLVTVVFRIFKPDAVTGETWLKSVLPVTHDTYWYLTAYTALYFFAPVLNAAVRALDEKKLKRTLIVFFIVFSVYDNIPRHFKFERGYSFVWLALLYFAGAAIKKCGIGKDLGKRTCFLMIFLLTALAWGYKMVAKEFTVFGFTVNTSLFIAYTSPLTLLSAVLYLIAFSKMKIKGLMLELTKTFAPGAFAVYILNCHPLVWNNLMNTVYVPTKAYPVFAVICVMLLFSAAFTFGALMIDRLRVLLFKLLHIPQLTEKAFEAVKKPFINNKP